MRLTSRSAEEPASNSNKNNRWNYLKSKLIMCSFLLFALAKALMLKCERYSSVVIPPFPTSSMSGSENTRKNEKVSLVHSHFYIYQSQWKSNSIIGWDVTIPSAWFRIGCPFIVLISSTCHTNRDKYSQFLNNIRKKRKISSNIWECQLLPVPGIYNISSCSPAISYTASPGSWGFLPPA